MKTSTSKILIVEDEQIVALDIKKRLEKEGYEITGVISAGLDVFANISKVRPDLILMDIRLSGDLDGVDIAKVIDHKHQIPIVYLTALNDEETMRRASETKPFGYILKPFDERELRSVIEIALYKAKIEKKIKEKNEALLKEKSINGKLLENILPKHVINELMETGKVNPQMFNQISILFTDFYNFDNLGDIEDPDDFLRELNEIFYKFDDIIEEHGLEKLKTIGDIYMIGSGFPVLNENHAINITKAAIKMRDYINERSKNSKYKLLFRAGINSGEVVAGVVGNKKFTYDVWGDTVNIASRLESSSEPGQINISEATFNLIKNNYKCRYRGKLNAKGKGEIDMYYIKDEKSETTITKT